MLSNADTPFIRQLYQAKVWRLHKVMASRPINSRMTDRKAITELIITSYDV